MGRTAELGRIDAFLAAVAGGPATLLLEGELGVGESALWREAVARSPHRVLSCRPVEAETQLAYAARRGRRRPVARPSLRGRARIRRAAARGRARRAAGGAPRRRADAAAPAAIRAGDRRAAAARRIGALARTELFISPKTVQWNLSKVYKKLGIRSRAELPGAMNPAIPPVSRAPVQP